MTVQCNFSTVNSLMSYFSFMLLYPWLFFISSGGNPFCLFAQDTSVRGLVSFAALGKQWGWRWVRIMGVLVCSMWWVCVFVQLSQEFCFKTDQQYSRSVLECAQGKYQFLSMLSFMLFIHRCRARSLTASVPCNNFRTKGSWVKCYFGGWHQSKVNLTGLLGSGSQLIRGVEAG